MTNSHACYPLYCLIAVLLFGAPCNALETATSQPQEVEVAPDLSQQILGAWVVAGRPNAEVEPKPGTRMKVFSRHHWFITEYDPDTGEVIHHHGGTYTLDGNKYLEKVTFANEPSWHMIGSEFRFTIKIEDGKYTQIGDGNPWTEVWKRPAK